MTSPEPEEEMEETIVVTMVDDEGGEEDFALLDLIEVDGRRYGLFAPTEDLEGEEGEEETVTVGATKDAEPEDDEDDEDGGILVLRAVQRGTEEDFEIIENEEEFNKVLEHLEQMAINAPAHYGSSINNN